MAALRLTEIPQHLLRVSCRRCSRTVEIQKIDAIRLASAMTFDVILNSLRRRLLLASQAS